MENDKRIKAAFRVGDIITNGGNLCRVLYVGNTSYIYKDESTFEDKRELITVIDANYHRIGDDVDGDTPLNEFQRALKDIVNSYSCRQMHDEGAIKHGAELLRIARKIIVDEVCRDMMKYNI